MYERVSSQEATSFDLDRAEVALSETCQRHNNAIEILVIEYMDNVRTLQMEMFYRCTAESSGLVP